MNGKILSVIIPTYNRKDLLKMVLNSLFGQTYPKDKCEIIVIDDGSTDGTNEMLNEIMRKAPCELRYFRQKNKGPGSSRNIGIKHARGELILFIDDDVLPIPNLLEQHANMHKKYNTENVAILGTIMWSTKLKISPFMYWLIREGPHFAHSREKDGARLDYKYFCTANISLKRSFIIENGIFNEDLRMFEDIELGYRLQQQGLQVIHSGNAVGYHLRGITIEEYACRNILAGKYATIFYRKWPKEFTSQSSSRANLKQIPKRIIGEILRPFIPILKYLIGRLDYYNCKVPYQFYSMILSYYFRIGMQKGLNERLK